MNVNIDNLKAKGWSDYEIQHAIEVLVRAEEEKHPRVKLLDEALYWFFLIMVVGGNVLFSLSLLPVIAILPNMMLYVVIGFTGIVFGTLCTTLLKSLDKIDTHHHIIYTILVPIAGIVNFFFLVHQANNAVELLGFGVTHSPWGLGVVYLLLFFLPYAVFFRKGDFQWT